MQNFNFSKAEVQPFVQSWYDASQNINNTTERVKLYEKTEQVVKYLKENKENAQVKELCEPLINAFGLPVPADKNRLSKWIAENTSYQGTKKFLGAYQQLHHLFKAINKVQKDPESNKNTLAFIDADSLDQIFKLQSQKMPQLKLTDDIKQNQLFSRLSNKDLLAMRATSASNDTIAQMTIIDQLNAEKITPSDLGISTVTDLIAYFGENCSKIFTLNLEKFTCIQDSDIEMLSKYFTKLKYLLLKNGEITNKSLDYFAQMPLLVSLGLDGCAQIKDISALKPCTKLTALSLSGCTEIKDISVLEHCKELTTLLLIGCAHIEDISILANCTKLEGLDLTGCAQIKDISVLKHCKELMELGLNGCVQIEDISGLEHCKELMLLGLNGCAL